jgi:hypothetical protein
MKTACFITPSLVLGVFLCLAVLAHDVSASTMNWDNGAADSLWGSANNWSSNIVPTSTDDARIDIYGAYALIQDGTSAVCGECITARSAGVTGVTLEMTGGTLAAGIQIYVGQYAGASGTFLLKGGSVTSAGHFSIGSSGEGFLDMTGGSVAASGTFYAGRYGGGIGHAELHGGIINCADFTIGIGSSVNISDTGTIIVTGDKRIKVNGYISANPSQLTACGGAGAVLVDYNVTNPGKTTIKTSCTTSNPVAINPSPASDISVEVTRNVDFSWTPGLGAAYHNVYLGTVYSDVLNANTFSPAYQGQYTANTYDPGTLKRGYTYYWRIDELNSSRQLLATGDVWSFRVVMFDPNDLGPVAVTPNWAGIRTIPAAPAAGVHPRIYFGPDELPGLKTRLQTTASGQEVMKQIYAYVKLMEVGASAYNRTASYALDSFGNSRIDNTGLYDAKTYYDKLAAGTASALTGADTTKLDVLVGNMAVMAFYYLINDNIAGQQKTAAAISNFVTYPEHTTVHFVHIAYCYDLLYNQMTTAQRNAVRQAIHDLINGNVHVFAYTEAYATTGNWATLNFFWPVTYMAIEGETDAAPITYDSAVRSIHNFLTYGWYDDGSGWEGLGKNYQWLTALIAFAKRGEDFIAHPHVRAFGERFLPALMQPFGHAFSAYDAWGGSGTDQIIGGYKFNANDAVGLKWILPNSPQIDFVWRNYVEHHTHPGSYNMIQFSPRGYENALLLAAIFSSDYQSGVWDSRVCSLTEFFSEGGLITTRSDNSSNALGMQFQCRQNFGGHTHADRNNFNLSALGRTWGVYRTDDGSGPTGATQETKYHSCLLIDVDPADPNGTGYGIPLTYQDGTKARQPGKILDFIDADYGTFAAGDATYSYSWEWKWIPAERSSPDPTDLSQGWQEAMETLNDFRTKPGTNFWLDVPFYQFAHWNTYPLDERIIKRPSARPMSYVYRSAGLVRGAKPYALIADDARVADGTPHRFWWQMQLPSNPVSTSIPFPGTPTLSIESTYVNQMPQNYRCDVILKEQSFMGNRRLLVRVLQNDGFTGVPAFIFNRIEPRFTNANWPALIVEATNCYDPKFKILLYPHYSGDALPTTAWNGNQLTVTLGTQVDTFNFSVGTDNRTRIAIQQNNCGLLPYDGDMNRDGKVDLKDLSEFSQYWLNCYNTDDFMIIGSNWLQ